MILPKFEHLGPPSIEEAVRLLTECGAEARVPAGGTDLLPRMKYGLIRPGVVISLRGIPAKAPRVDPQGDLRLDGLMSLADVTSFPGERSAAPYSVGIRPLP